MLKSLITCNIDVHFLNSFDLVLKITLELLYCEIILPKFCKKVISTAHHLAK